MKEKESGGGYGMVFTIFIILAILTGVEFVVSTALNSPALLFIIALAKAGIIVNYFMHVYRLWREEDH